MVHKRKPKRNLSREKKTIIKVSNESISYSMDVSFIFYIFSIGIDAEMSPDKYRKNFTITFGTFFLLSGRT
jgi:hypothetical protein